MTVQPQNWPGFSGGLNLRRVALGDGIYALDAMNVTFTVDGGVRSRVGYNVIGTGTAGTSFNAITGFEKRDGTRQIIASQGNILQAYSTAGVSLGNTGKITGTNGNYNFARYGTSAVDSLYAANGVDTMQRWTGSAWASVSSLGDYSITSGGVTGQPPNGKILASTTFDYRLAMANYPGSGGNFVSGNSPSTLRFSDPGAPHVWKPNTYIEINPGDGEAITALASFGQQLFVFKRNSMHVVYGNSGSGESVTWNWRTLVDSVGCVGPDAITVGPDGVYFVHDSGVYVTKGGAPELLSGPVTPIFKGRPPVDWLGGTLSRNYISDTSCQWHEGELHISYPADGSSTHSRVLVYHTDFQWWAIGDQRYKAITVAPIGTAGQNELVATLDDASSPRFVHQNIAYTTDAGTSIKSRWRSDWTDFGISQRKTSNGLRIWGDGSVWVGQAADFTPASQPRLCDFASGADTWGPTVVNDLQFGAVYAGAAQQWGPVAGITDTWGDGAHVSSSYARAGARGTVYSLYLSSADSRPWAVYRATLQIRGVAPVTTITEGE